MKTYYLDLSSTEVVHLPTNVGGDLHIQTRLDIRGNSNKGLVRIKERYEAYFIPYAWYYEDLEEADVYRFEFNTIDELYLFVKRYFAIDEKVTECELN